MQYAHLFTVVPDMSRRKEAVVRMFVKSDSNAFGIGRPQKNFASLLPQLSTSCFLCRGSVISRTSPLQSPKGDEQDAF
jgi:hypothetical protein